MKNYIPDELIEEIRLRNDIVDVVSEYVKLEKEANTFLVSVLFIMKRQLLLALHLQCKFLTALGVIRAVMLFTLL